MAQVAHGPQAGTPPPQSLLFTHMYTLPLHAPQITCSAHIHRLNTFHILSYLSGCLIPSLGFLQPTRWPAFHCLTFLSAHLLSTALLCNLLVEEGRRERERAEREKDNEQTNGGKLSCASAEKQRTAFLVTIFALRCDARRLCALHERLPIIRYSVLPHSTDPTLHRQIRILRF